MIFRETRKKKLKLIFILNYITMLLVWYRCCSLIILIQHDHQMFDLLGINVTESPVVKRALQGKSRKTTATKAGLHVWCELKYFNLRSLTHLCSCEHHSCQQAKEYTCRIFQASRDMEEENASNRKRYLV